MKQPDSRAATSIPSARPGLRSPAVFVLVPLLLSCRPLPCEEIDRLLVSVNRQVITQSDLRLSRNLNALVSRGGNPASAPEGGSPASNADELDRMIDLELLRQELTNFPAVRTDPAEIERTLEELRGIYAELGGLSALLDFLGLQEEELRDYIRLQVSILGFIEFRFRPFATVAPGARQKYYDEVLVPRLRSEKLEIPPLAEVSDQIDGYLVELEVNAALERWLENVRSQAVIEHFVEARTDPREAKDSPDSMPSSVPSPSSKRPK